MITGTGKTGFTLIKLCYNTIYMTNGPVILPKGEGSGIINNRAKIWFSSKTCDV
ncbi:hypothetical protein SA3033_08190 [Aggregatibacter actinomycetemcomitans serotype d str. SA3033]|nr:hypothetical protein SA3033_08190 [Aggregatibacter actinomycetemcomitans serotype d str. SA3033]KYK85127.1 hypothetical protein SA508_09705 [Aggregatibacter actinomycetemcomitans serotype d str. SA508]KYK85653.1 hypothetical protein SA2200_09050 [Aggregatibacter actinomycetemcomitans serotype d str. SA2200]KYK92092.1 hypothetical protein SA269_08080 [Aggregatibacter actinomycetemcomitans serotype d str. SA269]KYK96971.1 hypothetical protein SA3733_00945 [Aggregatibacter actinomycetemcomitans